VLFASVLELGTGFHEELTGRENIYLKGFILAIYEISSAVNGVLLESAFSICLINVGAGTSGSQVSASSLRNVGQRRLIRSNRACELMGSLFYRLPCLLST
jgi:hypothetical protein